MFAYFSFLFIYFFFFVTYLDSHNVYIAQLTVQYIQGPKNTKHYKDIAFTFSKLPQFGFPEASTILFPN